MLCLDSYVIMDLMSNDNKKITKAASYFREVERNGGAISSLALTEVFFHIAKRSSEEKAEDVISFTKSIKNLVLIDANEEISIIAGRLRYKYYKKGQRELSFLDCIHLATAICIKADKFVTGDKDFLGVEEIKVIVY